MKRDQPNFDDVIGWMAFFLSCLTIIRMIQPAAPPKPPK